MPPRRPIVCQFCSKSEFKYTCANCRIVYCSVPCYKEHIRLRCKSSSDRSRSAVKTVEPDNDTLELTGHSLGEGTERSAGQTHLETAVCLRPLTSLKWPNVPPPPSIVDPLTANEPKSLQLSHYEAIATSQGIRTLLNENPTLPAILKELNSLHGMEREAALEAVLGVSMRADRQSNAFRWFPREATEDDLAVLRTFMDAVGKTIIDSGARTEQMEDLVALETAE